MEKLFTVQITPAEAAPALEFRESDEEWQRLQTHVLGRTLLVTSRKEWDAERLVRASRVQSDNERFFRDVKHPAAASMLPLRHRHDPSLRSNALVVVLGLLLAKVMLRRLRKKSVPVRSVGAMVKALKEVQRARMLLPDDAPPALRGLAATTWVPRQRTELQEQILRALGLERSSYIGTTLKLPKTRSGSAKKRKK